MSQIAQEHAGVIRCATQKETVARTFTSVLLLQKTPVETAVEGNPPLANVGTTVVWQGEGWGGVCTVPGGIWSGSCVVVWGGSRKQPESYMNVPQV